MEYVYVILIEIHICIILKDLFFLSRLDGPLGHLKIAKDVYGQRPVSS